MPPYLTEPLLAAQLQLPADAVDALDAADADEDVAWLFAFLSADRLNCYCLYQSACPPKIA